MNVLHVIPSFAPAWRYGGPIVAALGLTRELARQGHTVSVATTNIDGPGELDVPLCEPVPIDDITCWYFPVQHPRWYHFSAPMGRALKRLVRQSDIVHIHSVFLWPTTAAAFWCRRFGVPYLVRTAGFLDPASMSKRYEGRRASVASRTKKWLYLKTLGRRDIGGAAGLHFTSEAELESALRLRRSPKGYVIPLGVDAPPVLGPDGLAGVLRRHPQLQGRKIVLFLSRLDPIKGLDILITALGSLANTRDDFSLIIAGSGHARFETHLRTLIDQHGLSGRTVLTGMVGPEDKWPLLSVADVFALPSHHENFGVAVVEAMASGTPVVVSDRVGIHREISAARAGLVTRLEPAELSRAIGRLLDNPGAREQMGRAGEALATQKYSWERAASDVGRLYEDIVGQRAGGNACPVRCAVE